MGNWQRTYNICNKNYNKQFDQGTYICFFFIFRLCLGISSLDTKLWSSWWQSVLSQNRLPILISLHLHNFSSTSLMHWRNFTSFALLLLLCRCVDGTMPWWCRWRKWKNSSAMIRSWNKSYCLKPYYWRLCIFSLWNGKML